MSAETVTKVFDLAGGKIVGRVRLQKIVFLLEMAGAECDFSYDYHHYGPYSDDLSTTLFWAETEGLIEEEFAFRVSDGARYSVFQLSKDVDVSEEISGLSPEQAKEIVGRCEQESSTVLELAATAVWLRRCENIDDWLTELKSRKASKASDDRVAKALKLLDDCAIPIS